MEQKIVAHMKTGAVHKGITLDFEPARESFHVLPAEGGGIPIRIAIKDMKALFWVKDYLGNRDFVARRRFEESGASVHRAAVVFLDGEEIWGTLGDNHEDGCGFFLYPADSDDNNVRIFVNRSAMKEMRLVS